MGISFRLDARLEAQVRRHAADTRTTISAVVRYRSNKPLLNLLR